MSAVIFADNMNGLSVSQENLAPGDTFNVSVSVPAAVNADTAYIKVEFDASVFEVRQWEPQIAGGIYNSGDGFFVLTAANASREIDLSRGYSQSALLAVKYGVYKGDYTFRLTQHSFSYMNDNGFDYIELWQPSVTEVTVHIGDRSANSPAVETTTTTTTYSYYNEPDTGDVLRPSGYEQTTTTRIESRSPEVTTQYIYTSRIPNNASPTASDVTRPPVDVPANAVDDNSPADEEVIAVDDTTRPAGTSDDDITLVPVGVAPDASDEIELFGQDNDETYIPAETTRPAKTTAAEIPTADIELHSKLNGLSEGKVAVSTLKGYFKSSVDIVLTNSDQSEKFAKTALRSLGMSGSAYYSFDVSLYDIASGKNIHELPGGYVDLWVPVPKTLAGKQYTYRVYRVDGGVPTLVSADAAAGDGTKVFFRTSEFSPYMIVGIANDTEPVIVPAKTPSEGTRNPHTGVTAAIALPAAFFGCFTLVRKKGRRKRSDRRN